MNQSITLIACAVMLHVVPAGGAPADQERLAVAFVVWDGMELIESMGPAHVFSFAPGMDEYTVSASTDPIRSEFVTIVPEYTFENCPEPDVIVIPGGGIWVPRTDEAYGAWLKRNVPKTRLTVSVCNSAILLAELGLLDGREATCAQSNIDDIMLLGRDVKGYVNRRWMHDGNIITSKSYLGGLDAAIYAVRVLRGEEGERQVLGWSNYEGDLSKYDELHAQPGIVPVSRRREIVRILERDGVDAAVARFREWKLSGAPAYVPPFKASEPDKFQWMAWGAEKVGHFDQALRICEFKVRVWPDSAREHAYLGEALLRAGRPEEALPRLLESLRLDETNRPALAFTKELLESTEVAPSEKVSEAREILARQGVVVESSTDQSARTRSTRGEEQPVPAGVLARLGDMLVGEWVSQGAWADGRPFYARTRYEWGVGHQLIRGRTYAKTDQRDERLMFETLFYHDPESDTVEFTAISSWGRVDRGVVTSQGGGVMLVEYRSLAEDPEVTYKQRFERRSADRLEWSIRERDADASPREGKLIVEVPWLRKAGEGE